MDKKKIIIVAIVAILITSGGSFYAGMKYSQLAKSFSGLSGRNSGGANFRVGQMMGGGFGDFAGKIDSGLAAREKLGGMINGEVISKDETGLTVKAKDGNSRIVFISGKTAITRIASSTKEEIIKGLQANVFGKANPDGSITAENIQIR